MQKTTKENKIRIAVFCHLYYKDTYNDFSPGLKALRNYQTEYFFNIVPGKGAESLISEIRSDFPEAYVLTSPNIGKDIGGKLALQELYRNLKMESDFKILIHDKKSPQMLNGKKWKNELLKIVEEDKIPLILNIFKEEQDVGIIGGIEHISNEFEPQTGDFKSNNNALLKEYIKDLGLSNEVYSFVAGNMFWVRSKLFDSFFSEHPPLNLRAKLEKGNVLDTHAGTRTHSLERVFSWIVLDEGYRIKGI